MAINPELTAVLAAPTAIGTVCSDPEWASLEATIGTVIPSDIKEFNRTYGSGCLSDWVIMPLLPTPDGLYSFVKANEASSVLLHQYVADGYLPGSVKIYPEPGGLLEWADSGDGDMWFWVTEGDPESWTVAAIPQGYASPIYYYDMSATTYLSLLLQGALEDDFAVELTTTDFDPPLSSFRPEPLP